MDRGTCSWDLKRVVDDWVTNQQKCNNNRNKAHNKCKGLESSPNHSPTPTPPRLVHGKIILWETGPWCQKGWGPVIWPFCWCFPLDSLRSHGEHLQSDSQPTIWGEVVHRQTGTPSCLPAFWNIPPLIPEILAMTHSDLWILNPVCQPLPGLSSSTMLQMRHVLKERAVQCGPHLVGFPYCNDHVSSSICIFPVIPQELQLF